MNLWSTGASPDGAALSPAVPGANTLVGGHSTESETNGLGCTVIGEAQGPPLVKSALQAEDLLLLTKPLGLGVLLAGDMRVRTLGRPAFWNLALASAGLACRLAQSGL